MRADLVRPLIALAVGIVLTLLAGMLPGILAPIGYVAGVLLIVIGIVLLVLALMGGTRVR